MNCNIFGCIYRRAYIWGYERAKSAEGVHRVLVWKKSRASWRFYRWTLLTLQIQWKDYAAFSKKNYCAARAIISVYFQICPICPNISKYIQIFPNISKYFQAMPPLWGSRQAQKQSWCKGENQNPLNLLPLCGHR